MNVCVTSLLIVTVEVSWITCHSLAMPLNLSSFVVIAYTEIDQNNVNKRDRRKSL